MDPSPRILVSCLTTAMMGLAACVCAQPAPTVVAPTVAGVVDAAIAEKPNRDTVAQSGINDAVRDLERATLQWDFSNDASKLALLQHAHDQLSAAASRLKGLQRERAIELLADLDHAVQRAASRLGPLTSPAGEAFSPRAPSRNQLAQLVNEAQDLERGTSTAHRLLDGNGLGSTGQRAPSRQAPRQQMSTDPANADLPSQPRETRATWPQIHFRF